MWLKRSSIQPNAFSAMSSKTFSEESEPLSPKADDRLPTPSEYSSATANKRPWMQPLQPDAPAPIRRFSLQLLTRRLSAQLSMKLSVSNLEEMEPLNPPPTSTLVSQAVEDFGDMTGRKVSATSEHDTTESTSFKW